MFSLSVVASYSEADPKYFLPGQCGMVLFLSVLGVRGRPRGVLGGCLE